MEISKKLVSPPPPPQHQLTLKIVLSESCRIIKSQHRLYLALALLFFVPLPAAYAFLQTLIPGISSPGETNFISIALLVLLSLIFSSCATISITFAAFRSYNNAEPTNLRTALKSIPALLLPYLATSLLGGLIIFVAVFVFTFITAFIVTIIAGVFLGFDTLNPTSPYLIAFIVLLGFIPFFYFKIIWFLSLAVVVVESKWGFEALRTSKGLIKGKMWTLVSLVLFLGFFGLIIFSSNGAASFSLKNIAFGSRTSWMSSLGIAMWVVLNICFSTVVGLYAIVATTVFYGICQASKRVRVEYSSLPVNDEKV